ncbi:MAG: ABC transporter permease [Caldilinea sp. CFX5]|nr:ABC transporter permease [Caldilinea sp. CFX5]
MRNSWLVAKHAIKTTVQKRSFWITTLLLPVVMLALLTYNELSGSTAESARSAAEAPAPLNLPAIGLVDAAGLINKLPPGFPADLFTRFPDQTAARVALAAGTIAQYVYIPADYLARGAVTVYERDYQLMRSGAAMGLTFGSANAWVLSDIINFNLIGDAQLVAALRDPTPGQFLTEHRLQPPPTGPQAQTLTLLIAQYLPTIFYMILMIGSGYLLQGVTAEKENRTAELLLLSLHPRELMAGKLVGYGVVTLIQVLAWLGSLSALALQAGTWPTLAALTFPPSFFIWALFYLVAGYFLYGSLMAMGGALAPTTREGNKMTWLVVAFLLPGLLFASEFAEAPHSALAVTLSLFPLTAPNAMVARLAVTSVPLWQLALSLSGLAATTAFFVVLAGRFFRSDNLLSTAAFSWRRLATGWRT